MRHNELRDGVGTYGTETKKPDWDVNALGVTPHGCEYTHSTERTVGRMGTAVTTMAALGLAHVDGVVGDRDIGLNVVPQLCHIRSGERDVGCSPTVYLCARIGGSDA